MQSCKLRHTICAGPIRKFARQYGEFSVNTDWYTPPCAQAQVRASDIADTVMMCLETL